MEDRADILSLRITLKHDSLTEFETVGADDLSSMGIFIRTNEPKPVGTRIRFELLVSDGTRALRGEAVIVAVRDDDRPGMTLRFTVLDRESRDRIDRVVARKARPWALRALAPLELETTDRIRIREAKERARHATDVNGPACDLELTVRESASALPDDEGTSLAASEALTELAAPLELEGLNTAPATSHRDTDEPPTVEVDRGTLESDEKTLRDDEAADDPLVRLRGKRPSAPESNLKEK